jgi:TetR/AcrR family transcriptional repressor of nem operon
MSVNSEKCKDNMRYPPGHKQEKRKELLNVSSALIKEGGYAATGIDSLMQAAGVTSGAFYSHFASKKELFGALIAQELFISREQWAENPHSSAEDWLSYELDRYLTLRHVRHPDAGCILPTLGAEIARADASVKEIYEEEMLKGVAILTQRLGSEERAWAMICQMVGAMLLARAMPTEAGQTAILESSKHFLRGALSAAR